MRIRFQALVLGALVLSVVSLLYGAERVEIRYDYGPQREVLQDSQLIDGKWCLVGSGKRSKTTFHISYPDGPDHPPTYHFWADPAANRIELGECFATESDAAKIGPENLRKLTAIADVYGLANTGDFGDTIAYSWETRFPDPMNADTRGIFAQWHGRPDRSTVMMPDGTVKVFSIDEFLALQETVTFKDTDRGREGFEGSSVEPNGMILDGAAGGPIGAFKIGEDHLYLIVRDNPDLVSKREQPKPKAWPGNERFENKGRTAHLVYKMPIDQVPIDEWIAFKVEIRYSDYDSSGRISNGHVKVWLDDRKVADWTGPVGKNDYLGPYFKFGIYKPGPDGFRVDHRNYQRTLVEKGNRPYRLITDYLKK